MTIEMDLQITPQTVQQQTVERLRKAIITGMFQPGERLSETRLCQMLGISRPSVREALRSLEASKLITIVPNRGPHIPILNRCAAEDLYSVRALLEGEACALCAEKRSSADIATMRDALQRFESETGNTVGLLSTTTEFYDRILSACGNSIIREILLGLHDRVNLLRVQTMSTPGRSNQSYAEMKAMLNAIEKADSEAARAAAIHHVRQAEQAALASLAAAEPQVKSG